METWFEIALQISEERKNYSINNTGKISYPHKNTVNINVYIPTSNQVQKQIQEGQSSKYEKQILNFYEKT